MRTDAVLEPFADGIRLPVRPEISAWAEENMRFDTAIDASPRFIIEKSPYSRTVFDWWLDPEIEEIFLLWPTQAGKTTAQVVLICYTIKHDPGPLLYAQADQEPTQAFIKHRLKPTLKFTFPHLVSGSSRDENWNDRKGIIVGRMHLWPAWGSSEGRLRSWPRRYILGDETSIWKNTRHYAWERTKQFPRNRKALWATTPTYEEEQSWQSANNVFRLHRWMITCPGCAVIQPLEFKDLVFEQFRDEGGRWDLEAVEAETTWRCPHCQAQVQPKQRAALLQAGSAGVVEEAADRPRRQMSLRVTALDVPNIPWGETARKFLEAKAAPLDLKNFINSWLVEPWKDQEEGVRAVRVLSRSMDLNAGQCPENTDYILAGIDTQRGHVWVTVRAFLSDGRSVLLHCAKVEGHTTASALELCFKDVIEKAWPAAGDTDRILPVRLAVVDCADGETAEEVYKFAWRHPGRIWLIRGGVNMTNTWTAGIMDKYPNGKSIPGGVPYYKCSTSHYRERVIGAYLLSMKDEGAWLVASGTPTWYGDHIESWQLVSEQTPRGIKRVWKQIRRDDHCLDAELYCLCLADILKFVPVKVKAGEKPKAVHQLKRRPPARPQKPPKTRHNSIRRKY